MAARNPRVRDGEEVWETTTAGTVWVPITDARGRERHLQVGGEVGSRLRITAVDREAAQDAVVSGNDPFVNGMLRRVDASQDADERTASDQALSTEELLVGFSKNGAAFRAFVDKLNEFNVRRMHGMTEAVDASVAQVNYLGEKVRSYRPKGNDEAYADLTGAR